MFIFNFRYYLYVRTFLALLLLIFINFSFLNTLSAHIYDELKSTLVNKDDTLWLNEEYSIRYMGKENYLISYGKTHSQKKVKMFKYMDSVIFLGKNYNSYEQGGIRLKNYINEMMWTDFDRNVFKKHSSEFEIPNKYIEEFKYYRHFGCQTNASICLQLLPAGFRFLDYNTPSNSHEHVIPIHQARNCNDVRHNCSLNNYWKFKHSYIFVKKNYSDKTNKRLDDKIYYFLSAKSNPINSYLAKQKWGPFFVNIDEKKIANYNEEILKKEKKLKKQKDKERKELALKIQKQKEEEKLINEQKEKRKKEIEQKKVANKLKKKEKEQLDLIAEKENFCLKMGFKIETPDMSNCILDLIVSDKNQKTTIITSDINKNTSDKVDFIYKMDRLDRLKKFNKWSNEMATTGRIPGWIP